METWLYKRSRIPSKSCCLFFTIPSLPSPPPYHSRPEQRGHVSASAHRNQDAAIITTLLHSCWKPAVAHHGSESSESLSPLWPPAWLTAAPPSRTSHSHREKFVNATLWFTRCQWYDLTSSILRVPLWGVLMICQTFCLGFQDVPFAFYSGIHPGLVTGRTIKQGQHPKSVSSGHNSNKCKVFNAK